MDRSLVVEPLLLGHVQENLQDVRLHHQSTGTMTLDVLELTLGNLVLPDDPLGDGTELKPLRSRREKREGKGSDLRRNRLSRKEAT